MYLHANTNLNAALRPKTGTKGQFSCV